MTLTKEFKEEIAKAAEDTWQRQQGAVWFKEAEIYAHRKSLVEYFHRKGAEQAAKIFASRGAEFDEDSMLMAFESEDAYTAEPDTITFEDAFKDGALWQHAQSTLQYEAQIELLRGEIEKLKMQREYWKGHVPATSKKLEFLENVEPK